MVTKETCIPGTKVVVNDVVCKWNIKMGTQHNGLDAFPFNDDGVYDGEEFEVLPDTVLIILSPPKKFGGNGNRVKFRFENDDKVLSSWWTCFKNKVNIQV